MIAKRTGTGSTWSDGTQWSTGTAPGTGDTAIIDGLNAAAIDGSDELSTQLSLLRIVGSNRYNIGSPTAPLQIGADRVEINVDPDDGSSQLGASCISLGVKDGTIVVENSRTTGTNNLAPVLITGRNVGQSLIVNGGRVGIATGSAGEACTFDHIYVGDGRVEVSDSVLIETGVTINNGTMDMDVVPPSATVNGGTAIVRGTGKINTLTICGGRVYDEHRAASGDDVGVLNLRGGELRLERDSRTYTIGTTNGYGGRIHLNNASQLANNTIVVNWDTKRTMSLAIG